MPEWMLKLIGRLGSRWLVDAIEELRTQEQTIDSLSETRRLLLMRLLDQKRREVFTPSVDLPKDWV
jgi:hypothetical protein